jgi:hypothetical protein
MSCRRRRRTGGWWRLWPAGVLLALLALGAMIGWPPVEVAAQDGVTVNAVDDDSDNRLWNCPTNRIPFGNEDPDKSRCFTFRYQVPAAGITSAALHVAIKPLGGLQDTDSLVVAVGEPFADCAWAQGDMPGCVALHGGFRGGETSLNLDLLNVACDSSVQGSPEAQRALLAQLQTGVLHVMLQDDTAVFGAQMVLNGGPATFPCGTSEQPWTPPLASGNRSAVVLADTLSRLLTGSGDARPPSPAAAAGAAAAATAALGAYAAINGRLSRLGGSGPATARQGLTADMAAMPEEDRGSQGSQPVESRDAPTGRLPGGTAPGGEAATMSESDLRDALDKLKDHLEDLAESQPGATARLMVVRGRASKRVVALTSEPVSVGRDASNTLTLHDTSVSRRHAVVVGQGGGWVLTDQGSANGTTVNGTRVASCALRHGDQIRIGDATLLFEAAASVAWQCQRCGHANPPRDRFCTKCGTGRPAGG